MWLYREHKLQTIEGFKYGNSTDTAKGNRTRLWSDVITCVCRWYRGGSVVVASNVICRQLMTAKFIAL